MSSRPEDIIVNESYIFPFTDFSDSDLRIVKRVGRVIEFGETAERLPYIEVMFTDTKRKYII